MWDTDATKQFYYKRQQQNYQVSDAQFLARILYFFYRVQILIQHMTVSVSYYIYNSFFFISFAT